MYCLSLKALAGCDVESPGSYAAEEKRAHVLVTVCVRHVCVLCWRADVTGLKGDPIEGIFCWLPGFREAH